MGCAGARDLDRRSMEEWLAEQQQSGLDELALACIRMEFEANNGVTLGQQSWLGTLAYVKGGGIEAFWSDSESLRCDGGNQQLALKMAGRLGRRVRTGTSVASVDEGGRGFVVRTALGERIECDQVVVAVPPSVWRTIQFNRPLPAELVPQMAQRQAPERRRRAVLEGRGKVPVAVRPGHRAAVARVHDVGRD
ncbi:MAG: FAD-dependent oxidoreductase [Phycisphaerales bacterium]